MVENDSLFFFFFNCLFSTFINIFSIFFRMIFPGEECTALMHCHPVKIRFFLSYFPLLLVPCFPFYIIVWDKITAGDLISFVLRFELSSVVCWGNSFHIHHSALLGSFVLYYYYFLKPQLKFRSMNMMIIFLVMRK